MALANASTEASETAIRDKETAAAAGLQGFNRHSIAVEERDEWFQPQRLHLETFLENHWADGQPGLRRSREAHPTYLQWPQCRLPCAR